MQIAKLSDLKKELKHKSSEELLEVCLRLARYKKENKELLNYLLFESNDEDAYIVAVKEDISSGFDTIGNMTGYFIKKSIRKVLRIAAKEIKYSGIKRTEVEVLIFFCQQMSRLGKSVGSSRVMMNMFENQLKKIDKSLSTLHEDLQYDYQQEMVDLREWQEAQIRRAYW